MQGRKTGGRQKGTPNKLNAEVKEAIVRAFRKVGGEAYLVSVATDQPQVFCSLLGKVLPTELTSTLNGILKVELVEIEK